MEHRLRVAKPGREGQYRPPVPSGWTAAPIQQQPAPQANMCEEPRSSGPWELQAPHMMEARAQLPLRTSHNQGLHELSSTFMSKCHIRYLNIEQVQLHRVSRIHILIWVKELPSKQQCFVFIYSLFSECSAVIQPIYCNTRPMKERCLFFLLVQGELAKQQYDTDTDVYNADILIWVLMLE